MKIQTTRFGELEVNKDDVINFKDGILGFDNLKRFFVVDPGDQTLILWIQAIDDASVAFPIIEPKIFKPDYTVKLVPAEFTSIALEELSHASIYTILTIPQVVTEMTANLKAPIIINNKNKVARQIVLQDSKLEVRYPMYLDLKKYIVAYSSDDSKRTNVSEATIQASEIVTHNENRRPELQTQ
ncbi:MAG: flagellar assembly protein FliW [Bacteriovoracaceae bacterium]|nr:flagellar assembly protein FliW [Bacteriovoracaceae bacterium]